MITTRATLFKCPTCGKDLDAFSSPFEDAAPKEGDVSMCINCRTVMKILADGTARPFSAEEYLDLPIDIRRQLRLLGAAIAKVHDERQTPEASGPRT